MNKEFKIIKLHLHIDMRHGICSSKSRTVLRPSTGMIAVRHKMRFICTYWKCENLLKSFRKIKVLILNLESGTRFQNFWKNQHYDRLQKIISNEIYIFYLQTFWLNVSIELQLDTDIDFCKNVCIYIYNKLFSRIKFTKSKIRSSL